MARNSRSRNRAVKHNKVTPELAPMGDTEIQDEPRIETEATIQPVVESETTKFDATSDTKLDAPTSPAVPIDSGYDPVLAYQLELAVKQVEAMQGIWNTLYQISQQLETQTMYHGGALKEWLDQKAPMGDTNDLETKLDLKNNEIKMLTGVLDRFLSAYRYDSIEQADMLLGQQGY